MNDAAVRAGDILAGKYRVERVLGAGNMGLVVAATHVELGQLVALKLMLPGKAAGPELRERFLREARAAVRLRSQHVARVLDVGAHENGSPYIAMEFLEGQDLAAVLHARGQLPVDEAVEYVLQACEAVGEAHAAGIVHRDLKPANLFLTEDVSGLPCVKVLDFGVSKLVGDLTLTNDTQALGSPLYMSPEQINSSRDADARSDVWALGVLLYQFVAGRTPFDADTIQALCARVFFGQPTPLAEYRADAPPGFEAVILGCLARDREHRWRDVAELAAALAPYVPARSRVYVDRVSRVLRTKVAPTASAPELSASKPPVDAVPAPVPGSRPRASEALGSTPTGTARLTPPVVPPPSQEGGVTPLPAPEPPRAAASSAAAANSDVGLALAGTKKPWSAASQTHAHPRRGVSLVATGIAIALTASIAVVLALLVRGQRHEPAPAAAEPVPVSAPHVSAAVGMASPASAPVPVPPPASTPPAASSSAMGAAPAAANPPPSGRPAASTTPPRGTSSPAIPRRQGTGYAPKQEPADMYDSRR